MTEHDCKNLERLGKLEVKVDIHSIDIAQIKVELANAVTLCNRVMIGIDKLTENMNKHATEAIEYRAKINTTAKKLDDDEVWLKEKFDLLAKDMELRESNIYKDIDSREAKQSNSIKFFLWIAFAVVGSISIGWNVFQFLVRAVIH